MDRKMFPHFQDDFKKSTSNDYFGGEEPPTYHQISLQANASITDIAQLIYDMAYTKNVCGYITENFINYFVDERGKIEIDASKEFIFLAERGIEPFTHPTPLGIVRFLQDPCDKAIFISEGSAYYLEKTPKTYQLCVELDEIWDDNSFFESIEEIMDGDDYDRLNEILPLLMKEYERRKCDAISPVWDTVEQHKGMILEEKLLFHVEKFEVA